VLPPIGGQPRYRVFHSPTDIRDYDDAQLAPAEDRVAALSIATLLSGGTPPALDAATFRARLTAARLNHPQIDHIYALNAARIRFVPFQLKPLLRFLQADLPRLLIADDVGVGKTIEAGLILKEMLARQPVGNVLIVCPKALVHKWRVEMQRFDEDFVPLSGETLRYCLREAHLDGVWPQQYARAIAHLELLRIDEHMAGVANNDNRPGLLTLDPPPAFSLVIVDEAHHLRNPETRSHELARFLTDCSEAALFLSATPVHLGSRNLYTLLNLLRPDVFLDEGVFDAMLEPNRHLNSAMRRVRQQTPLDSWRVQAAAALDRAADTTWGGQTLVYDPRFTTWRVRLQAADDLSDADRVRCLRDLEELHTLAHVMNRTRRRDIGRFTIREPHTVKVAFTPEQQAFYEALLDFRRQTLLQTNSPIVVRLIMDTLERQAASCLPALARFLEGFLQTGHVSSAQYTDVEDDEHEAHGAVSASFVAEATALRHLAAALPPDDPKVRQLLDIATSSQAGQGPGKLLVFSFFLHTLDYLRDQLRAAGLRVAVISGRVLDEERERLRDRFRLNRSDPDALDVLLSSEVGCEGLDYEFCDRLVNYDIPWNPMRIEQRIGRIDRYGQRSPKVLIYNFINPGTVEERIFFRCFDRIGIFEDTVGDLESILGDTIQELSRAALNPALTAQQAEALAAQQTDNMLRLVEEQRRLEEEGGALLGIEHLFVDEVSDLVAEGRYVAADDLAQMIGLFLERDEINGRITPDAGDARLHRLRLSRAGRERLATAMRASEHLGRASVNFMRWLDGDEQTLPITFSQELAFEQRDLTFVTPLHPLARMAASTLGTGDEPLVAQLVVATDSVPPGDYLIAADLWETLAIHPEIQLVCHAWSFAARQPLAEVRLVSLLAAARRNVRTAAHSETEINTVLRELDEVAHQRRTEALLELRERNAVIIARQLASLNSYYASRMHRIENDLTTVTNERILRMRRAERARAAREHAARQQTIEDRREADILSRRIATCVLSVERGGDDHAM
jgi:superfamily II DNA or RNA helicase